MRFHIPYHNFDCQLIQEVSGWTRTEPDPSVMPQRYKKDIAKANFNALEQEAVTSNELRIGDVIDWTYSGNKLQPTQKPLSVLLPIVETFSSTQGVALDPFIDSGSSLLAAKMLGRRYISIEPDAEYHAIASQRLLAVPQAAPEIPIFREFTILRTCEIGDIFKNWTRSSSRI